MGKKQSNGPPTVGVVKPPAPPSPPSPRLGRVISMDVCVTPEHKKIIDDLAMALDEVTRILIEKGATREQVMKDPYRSAILDQLVKCKITFERPMIIVERDK